MKSTALALGQYAAFIWPAYAATVLLFAWMILDTLLRAAKFRAEVRRRETDLRK